MVALERMLVPSHQQLNSQHTDKWLRAASAVVGDAIDRLGASSHEQKMLEAGWVQSGSTYVLLCCY